MSKLKLKIADTHLEVKVTGVEMALKIDQLAYQKMMHFVDKAGADEVSGLGLITAKDNVFTVTDTFLLPQKNSTGATDIEPEDMAKLMFETRERPGMLRFWWHSHVRMATFWSKTDTDTMDVLAKGGWFMSLVVNQKREHRAAFRSLDPDLFIDEIPFQVMARSQPELVAQWDTEYDTKVQKKKTTAITPYRGEPYGTFSGKRRISRRQRKKRSKNGGAIGPGNDLTITTHPESGLQLYGKYIFTHPRNAAHVIAFIIPEDIKRGWKRCSFRLNHGGTMDETFDLTRIAELAREYVIDVSDLDDKIVWDEDVSEAQVELLGKDSDQFRFWSEVDEPERAEVLDQPDTLAAQLARNVEPIAGATPKEHAQWVHDLNQK